MDQRENARELADSIVEALIAELAKLAKVEGLDASRRRMTPNEFKLNYSSLCAMVFKRAHEVADLKMAQHGRINAGLRERIAYLERMLEPRLAGDRDTPIMFVDPIEVVALDKALDDTKTGWRLPEGVARSSQRPTPIK